MDKDIAESIRKYYSLKRDYMSNYNTVLRKILDNQNFSINAKKTKAKNIKLPCLLCKRLVNTNFSKTKTSLIISCGDKKKPCGKELNILVSKYDDMKRLVFDFEDVLNDTKTEIIDIKSRLLYDLIDESDAVDIFDKANIELNSISENLLEIVHTKHFKELNKEKAELILDKTRQLEELKTQASELIHIQKMNHEQLDTNSDNIVKRLQERQYTDEYVKLIKCNIQPLIDEIYTLKYDVKEIFAIDDNTVILHTRENSLQLYDIIADVNDSEIMKDDI